MGHCNHSLPSCIHHSPHVEHSLSPLLNFLWPQTTLPVLLHHCMWKATWSTVVLKNSLLQSPLSLICWTNLCIESVSGMDSAWWMFSGPTISSDLGKYTVITDDTNFMAASENSLGVWTTIWPDFIFRKMTFWWFRLHHPLGLYHGVLHCRTSTMTYSRTLFLLIVENKSGLKLSVHTITPQNDIGEWFNAFRLHSINHFFQTAHVILLWYEFLVTTTTLLFLISLVTSLK